jgi:DNA-binding LacI/PurR family transcriptional regulator
MRPMTHSSGPGSEQRDLTREERHGPSPRPSSTDVALLAGVSRATVSAYINKKRYVSHELSDRIESAIRQLNYVPDPFARALKQQDLKTIGLIIPVLSRFFTPMMQAINEAAHRSQYGFLVSSSEEDAEREREVLQILVAKRISGILLVPCSTQNRDLLRGIQQSGTPIVQVNRRLDGLDTDVVVSDNRKAAFRATEHLIQRGRRQIAFFGHDPTSLALADKKAGYDEALARYGVGESIVILLKQNDPADIRRSFERFLESGRPFDSLICTSQTKTSIALTLLKERSLRIPDQLSVVGFDDSPWAPLLCCPLTVVSESTYNMGEIAVQLLLDRLDRREAGPPKMIMLEDEFIVRNSS